MAADSEREVVDRGVAADSEREVVVRSRWHEARRSCGRTTVLAMVAMA